MAEQIVEDSDQLAERLRAGDEQALGQLFAAHRDRLWQIVNFRLDRRLSGRLDVDDILQEAYLDAARRIRHFGKGPPMSAFVWLRMIVDQTLIDIHRRHLGASKRDAKREVSMQRGYAGGSTSMSLAQHLLGGLTSPSQAAVRQELTTLLEESIAGMDDTDREVLALRHFEELTNSEVAEVLQISQAAASIRYVRALSRLKKILAEVPGFFGEGDSPD